jgi:hypothetical protein
VLVVSVRAKLWSTVRVACAVAATSLGCGGVGVTQCGHLIVNGHDEGGPRRDEWRVEVDAEFPHMADGEASISSIAIGGLTTQDNFANRGDVIVMVDGPEDRILVELRRFTWRSGEWEAGLDFETTKLLAHTGSLRPPHEIPDENRCGLRDPDDPEKFSPWQDACAIRVYYQGQLQPSRLGADIRVTLPQSYRGSILVTTEDNAAMEDYVNRGDICVQGLNGSLDAKLESGLAYVVFDREATSPPCHAPDLQECPDFGATEVESTGAADVNIDVAQDLWATYCLNTDGEITVDWPGADLLAPTDACPVNGENNRPEEYTPGEEGPYRIRATTAEASGVLYTDNPEEYVGPGNGDQQQSGSRGDIVLCAGCLGESACEEYLE